MNGNYIRIDKDQIDQQFCEDFEKKIAISPYEMFKKITESPIFDNPMAGKLFETARNELSGDDSSSRDEL